MKTKVNIRKLAYQRNGISGDGFFQALIDFEDSNEGIIDGYATSLIATFETTETTETRNKETVNTITCRVIDPLDFGNAYRGDNLGECIQKELDKFLKELKVERYYDLIQKL